MSRESEFMTMPRKQLITILFIFTVSGFSGLIYESIWTHYLKLFLGHAAYAQTLVLAIFMGGMALGSWICSRHSVRWNNLLIGYALAEGLIGLFQNSSLPVLFDFYSTTCAPCHMMHPILERLAARRAGQVAVAKVNVESHPEIAREFGVQAVPTFVVVFKGTERGRTAGAMDESTFALWVAGRT